MKHKRNHPLYIIKQMILIIKQMILPILIVFFANLSREKGWVLLTGTAVLLAIVFLFAILAWKNTVYYVENDVLFYENGILNKSKQGIFIDKITTINENQELIERIFQLSTFKVDAGSATKGNEIKLTINKKEAKLLKEALSHNKMDAGAGQAVPSLESFEPLTGCQLENTLPASESTYNTQEMQGKTEYHISVKELVLYAVMSNSFFAGLVFALAIVQFGQNISFVNSFIESSAMNQINHFLNTDIRNLDVAASITFILILLFVYILFSFIISIIMSVIKYYDFTVSRQGDKIEIFYGLINKKYFNLSVDKITALYLKYGFVGQFFKMGALKVESIGYGDEKGEAAILYPLISDNKREKILMSLLPEYAFIGAICRPPKRALRSFIIKFSWLPFLIAIILSFAVPYGVFSWVFFIISCYAGYIAYNKTRISREPGQVVLMGGILGKWIAVIKVSHIQAIITKQSFFQKRSGLVHLDYSYQSNNFGKKLGVQFVDQAEVMEMMEF